MKPVANDVQTIDIAGAPRALTTTGAGSGSVSIGAAVMPI
jgi:hypothetical protein